MKNNLELPDMRNLEMVRIATKSRPNNSNIDLSKHVGEKCEKLHIFYILSSKRGIIPSKIYAK